MSITLLIRHNTKYQHLDSVLFSSGLSDTQCTISLGLICLLKISLTITPALTVESVLLTSWSNSVYCSICDRKTLFIFFQTAHEKERLTLLVAQFLTN